jgi:hypothetical protein
MYGGTEYVKYKPFNTRKYGGNQIFKKYFCASLNFQLQVMTSAATAAILDIAAAAATTTAAILTPVPNFTGSRGPWGLRDPRGLRGSSPSPAPDGTVALPPPPPQPISTAAHD